MDECLSPQTLLNVNTRELATRIRSANSQYAIEDVSQHILFAIEEQSIPPYFWSTYLSAVDSLSSLNAGLCQRYSSFVRNATILHFGKLLRGRQWLEAWKELGDVDGLLKSFSRLSVRDVKTLCTVIGQSIRSPQDPDSPAKKDRITKLFQGLVPWLFLDAPKNSRDGRPLERYYARLLPACETSIILFVINQDVQLLWKNIPKRPLTICDGDLIRDCALRRVDQKPSDKWSIDPISDFGDTVVNDLLPEVLTSLPSASGQELGFSASMSFSLQLLEAAVESEHNGGSIPHFIQNLAHPLLRRMVRRRVPLKRQHQVFGLVLRYLEKHDEARRSLQSSSSILYYIVRRWSQDESLFEAYVDALFRLCTFTWPKDFYVDLVLTAAEPLRYRLLRTMLLRAHQPGLDLEIDADFQKLLDKVWPTDLFLCLHRDHGLNLLQRMLRKTKEDKIVRCQDETSVLCHPLTSKTTRRTFTDPYLLLTLLESRDGIGSKAAEGRIEEAKNKASKSRKQEDRAFYAQSAAFFAIASGSLSLYGNVVRWFKRFQRDPLTVRSIYSASTVRRTEGINLLSGLSQRPGYSDIEHLATSVIDGNRILLGFLQAALSAQVEPSFNRLDWQACFNLFHDVISCRMKNALMLKRKLALSEEQLYEVLWVNTIDMLIEVEKVGTRVENDRLIFSDPHGPLWIPSCKLEDVKAPLPSTFRFIDNLARARDALWTEIRRIRKPATTMLKPPWPRGLPVQCLSGPYDVATPRARKWTPFIHTRAAQVALIDLEIASAQMPQDDEIKSAIGGFVDSFCTACKIYMGQQDDQSAGRKQSSKVISHLVDQLSGRLSDREKGPFWRKVFRNHGVENLEILLDESVEAVKGRYGPLLPANPDPEETLEWNPYSAALPPLDCRHLEPIVLDCMLNTRIDEPLGPETGMPAEFSCTPTIGRLDIWSYQTQERVQHYPVSLQDGLIISSVLFLATLIGVDSKILTSPFPSPGHKRYPALYLDNEFFDVVNGKGQSIQSHAKSILSRLVKMVPTALLQRLVNLALEKLSGLQKDSNAIAQSRSITFSLAALLAKCDQPLTIINQVLTLILDFPDDSSWQRQILTRAFLQRLPAVGAHTFIVTFSNAIKDRIAAQQQRGLFKAREPGELSVPIIKLTTIKYFAQLIDEGDFISIDESIDFLLDLFSKSNHIDVQVAIISSLLSKLHGREDSYSTHLVDRVLQGLETTVHLLASPSEQEYLAKLGQDEDGGPVELPDIFQAETPKALPPLFGLIMDAAVARHRSESFSQNITDQIIGRVLVPAVQHSIESHTQWETTFLAKHGLSLDAQTLPKMPYRVTMLDRLVQSFSPDVPLDLISIWHRHAMTLLSLPDNIVAFNRRILEDKDFRKSNEGKHWLSLWSEDPQVCVNQAEAIVGFLNNSHHSDTESLVSRLQSMAVELALALARYRGNTPKIWDSFIHTFKPPLQRHRENSERHAWARRTKPVLISILQEIDKIRTPEWQQSSTRDPAWLPATYEPGLWLLEYPNLSENAPIEERCQEFASQLIDSLRSIVKLGIAHHNKLSSLKEVVKVLSSEDRARTASHVGALTTMEDEDPTTEQVLHIELVEAMLQDMKFGQGEPGSLREVIKTMVAGWQESKIEEVRMSGMRVRKALALDD